MIRPAADHRCTAENVSLSTAESTMKAVSATITAVSVTVDSLARPGEAEVTARPPCGSSMVRTLRPERSGNVTAGTAEVALGREPRPFGIMTGGTGAGGSSWTGRNIS